MSTWHLNPDDHQGIKENCIAVHDADGEIVAEYVTLQNARLIAAAPDLLAALEENVAFAEIMQEGKAPTKWLLKARAAIAKAKGE